MEEFKEPTLKEKIDELYYQKNNGNQKKAKNFKLPFKARLNKKKMRDGYVTIVKIEDNKNIDFTREPIIDGTIKLKDTFHAVDSDEVFFYKNKPLIFQSKRKLNPYNPLAEEHQTYGQKYIMARMKGDSILSKKSMGWGAGIGALILVGIIAYSIIAG